MWNTDSICNRRTDLTDSPRQSHTLSHQSSSRGVAPNMIRLTFCHSAKCRYDRRWTPLIKMPINIPLFHSTVRTQRDKGYESYGAERIFPNFSHQHTHTQRENCCFYGVAILLRYLGAGIRHTPSQRRSAHYSPGFSQRERVSHKTGMGLSISRNFSYLSGFLYLATLHSTHGPRLTCRAVHRSASSAQLRSFRCYHPF